MFRPTPRPLPDDKVTKSVRKFAQSIKTAAYFALNPIEKTDDPYNPRLYTPTGNTADPDSAALDHTLLQYEGVIERALEHTAVTPTPQWPSLREESTHSLGKHQRAAYRAIMRESKDGTGTEIALMADKDRAFVNVTVQQYMSMWKQHLSTTAYKPVEFSTVDWVEIVRRTRYLAKKALEEKLITPSQHRYLVKDCTGAVRYPRGSVMVKTHKPIHPSADPPAASRAYVDTVNYITSAWSRYLSVQLTPAREQIPNRISDTRDFICKLLKHRFKQDCWLGTADIVDFYPNTKVSGGEETIKKCAPPNLVGLCIEASRLIHSSLYVITPLGCYQLDGRYSIGLGHAAEVCDLDWHFVEQRVFQNLTEAQQAAFWCREIDDYFFVLEGLIEDREAFIAALKSADPDRPIKVSISTDSVDYLDVTIYKGHGFKTSGVLDTQPYTKPSYTGMHLPYKSHHPQSTFNSILSGYHNRSLITSSSLRVHIKQMNSTVKSFRMRGCPMKLLVRWLLQDTVKGERRFEEERKRQLTKRLEKHRQYKTARIIPLRLPYTPRTAALSSTLRVSTLQKAIEKSHHKLTPTNFGRVTLCNLKTANVKEATRPRGLLHAGMDERQR